MNKLSRRKFIENSGRLALFGAGLASLAASPLAAALRIFRESDGKAGLIFPGDDYSQYPEARYWLKADSRESCKSCHGTDEIAFADSYPHSSRPVKCLLCANQCIILKGERGKCRARYNDNGILRSLVYGRLVSANIDPIEKKPFYHFLPGALAFSVATTGCPLSCQFCQNWEISQASPEDFKTEYTPPERISAIAEYRKVPVIAYTYNEPTVFTEYMIDTTRKSKEKGLKNVLISCGFMGELPLKDMCENLDAIKIDLKGFSNDFYRNVCKADLEPVLRSIKTIARSGVHLEIVNLVVPTLNDSDKMMDELCKWVFNETGPDTPVHFTRFHPDYKLQNLPPTPPSTLEKARDIAFNNGLHFPYVGNIPGHPGNNTLCPECGKTVIERNGFFIKGVKLTDGKCNFCQSPVYGVWK